MPSTNKTPNIGIGQYLPNDVLSWNDINADNALVDTAVGNKLDKTDGGTVTGAVNFTGGLTKNGKTVADYETGMFKPILNGFTQSQLSRNAGRYVIIGSWCTVQFEIISKTTLAENLSLAINNTSLPVLPVGNFIGNVGTCYFSFIDNVKTPSSGIIRQYENAIYFYGEKTTSGWVYQIETTSIKKDTTVYGTFSYQI